MLNYSRGRQNPAELAKTIKYLVDERGYKQSDLAFILGYDKGHVSKLHTIAQHEDLLKKLHDATFTIQEAYEVAREREKRKLYHATSNNLTATVDVIISPPQPKDKADFREEFH